MIKMKIIDNTKCWQGHRATGILICCWWEHTEMTAWENCLAVIIEAEYMFGL